MPSDENANDLIDAEYSQRVGSYRLDGSAEALLRTMNSVLAPIETYRPSGLLRPCLFIFGLPRSGTTLLYQLVTACLDVGYINKLAARFWLAPLTGVTFARSVLGRSKDTSFLSDYGKSNDLAGPHEFPYFWRHWLHMDSVAEASTFDKRITDIDWNGLVQVISSLQDFFDAPMVFKTFYVANFLHDFARHIPQPMFIYIERDPEDVALSILNARRSHFGNVNSWWATWPPSYNEIKSLPFDQQIARQVVDLRSVYEQLLRGLPPKLYVRLTYQELCDNPGAAIEKIRGRVAETYNYQIGRAEPPPSRLPASRRTSNPDAEAAAVLVALDRLMRASTKRHPSSSPIPVPET